MKDNIKIALLAIIALGSMMIVYQLSVLNNFNEENANNTDNSIQNAIAANNPNLNGNNSNTVFDPTAKNPKLPDGVSYVDNVDVPPPVDMKKTSIKWEKMVHDFGTIMQNSTNKFAFKFTNTGTEPLLITNAVGSCGCTVPDYPKEPILPGKSAVINVEYKPGLQENQQEKTVTVTGNTEPMQTQLKIRAFVKK